MDLNSDANFDRLIEVCRQIHEATRRQAIKLANRGLVVRNLLFGYHIVEFEQGGEDRARYGASVLETLSARLSSEIGRGFAVDSLELMRRFYLAYGPPGRAGISETLSRILPESSELAQIEQFLSGLSLDQLSIPLSWSNYVTLLTITDPEERSFYEIEASQNQWSLRELKRQLNSSLYERLSLSRNQEEVRQLAEKGQLVESAADLIKNPYVLCKRKKDALVEITLPEDSNIHASEYRLYLPSKAELEAQLDSVRATQMDNGERKIENA